MASLPPLGGRLFVAYRITWFALAAIASAAVALTWFEPGTPVAIWGLRLTKSIALIIVSAILFHRRRRDAVAAMLALSFLLWTVSSSVDFMASDMVPAIVDRFRFLLFALALLLFPDGRWFPRWTRYVAAAIVISFLIGLAETLGPLSTRVYLPLAISCVLLAIAALMTRYRQIASSMEQQQLKWVALGLVVGISLILSARAGAALTAHMESPPMGAILLESLFQLGIVIVALGFLTSLLRYRLYDAETAISRSAVYAALTLALVGTFAACEAIIELLSQTYLGAGIGNISGAVAAAMVAVLMTPLHGRISEWAEQHFQRDLVTLKKQLPDLLAALSAGTSVRRLGTVIMPRIEAAVHSARIALLVDGKLIVTHGITEVSARRLLRNWRTPESPELFDRREEDPFPLRMALCCPLGSVRGWLLLSARPDGSYHGKDELDALAEIAPPLQRTLFLIAEREQERAKDRRAQTALGRSIKALADRLALLEAVNRDRLATQP